MTILQILVLAIVQGLTEFLPISSSGHLVLVQNFFKISSPPIFFDVLVHVGTLFAVAVFLRREIKEIILNLSSERSKKIIFLTILGSIPVVIVGLGLAEYIESVFSSLVLVGVSYIFTGILLGITFFIKKFEKELENISWKDSLFVGVFQAIAILPGVSRSGSTISAGLFRSFKKEEAFKFSFFLAFPAILGALFLEVLNLPEIDSPEIFGGLLGMIVSFGVGFFALKILEKVLKKGSFYLFSIYCFLLGTFILFFL